MIGTIRKYRCLFAVIIGLVLVITIYILGFSNRTVILVRHAEKGPGNDPPLIEEGQARAEELAEILGESGVSEIFTTQFVRTQQTAQPLADALGITLEVINLNTSDIPGYVNELTSQILATSAGEVMLVVSHSNTIPLVIEQLGAEAIPAIGDDEFDNLYIVTIPRWFGTPRLIRVRYGAP